MKLLIQNILRVIYSNAEQEHYRLINQLCSLGSEEKTQYMSIH